VWYSDKTRGHNQLELIWNLLYVGVACIRVVLGLNLGRDTAYYDCVSHRFLQSVQINSRIVSQLGYYCFLPNPFEFIINLPSYHSTVYSLRCSVVKWGPKKPHIGLCVLGNTDLLRWNIRSASVALVTRAITAQSKSILYTYQDVLKVCEPTSLCNTRRPLSHGCFEIAVAQNGDVSRHSPPLRWSVKKQ
jgi:hypothetical protein